MVNTFATLYAAAMKPAVLLVNLGTPDSLAPADVRRFLRAFLTDRRVIEMHPALWRPILEGIILRVRPRHAASLYAQIWGEKAGEGVVGSPLMHWSQAQRADLDRRLGADADVFLAMRYSAPTVRQMLTDLQRRGYRRVLVMPMYAQYSATTVASVMDEVSRWSLENRDQLEFRMVRSFPTDMLYIEAVASAIENVWEKRGARPDFAQGERLILSFHSLPQAMVDSGDPYVRECEATAKAVVRRLGLESEYGRGVLTTYQSVFGPAKWVGPATIDTVRELGAAGVRSLDVVCPGFATDCLETLQEINILNRGEFVNAGGAATGFTYIPVANDAPAFMDALEKQVRRGMSGWELTM
ncbi:ferrochelatase [Arcanobacterium canis]